MIAALILAGGTGVRMHTQGIPKQFLKVYGKPVIIYTLEHFQKHHLIDKIIVVSLVTHLNYMADLVSSYNLTKVSNIVAGGNTGQESRWNGLNVIKEFTGDDDIVLIHDGVRPVITQQLISDNIESVRNKQSGKIYMLCRFEQGRRRQGSDAGWRHLRGNQRNSLDR